MERRLREERPAGGGATGRESKEDRRTAWSDGRSFAGKGDGGLGRDAPGQEMHLTLRRREG